MESNREKVISHYAGYKEDERATSSKFNGLEFHYTKKYISKYITKESLVIEVGCGTGYYGMHFAGQCAGYMGVDISPDNIAVFNEKIAKEGLKNVRGQVGDATNLSGFSDNSFDVVLCFGPMYHLPRDERSKVFIECRRIAKDGAIVAFAYINGIGAYAGACVNDDWRSTYPNAEANKFVFIDQTDDLRPGVFYFTSPEEMAEDARDNGLKMVKNYGLDFYFAQSAVNMMSDEQFNLFMELADKMSESPSCTGLADHALMICRK